jgi:hypothetical protein
LVSSGLSEIVASEKAAVCRVVNNSTGGLGMRHLFLLLLIALQVGEAQTKSSPSQVVFLNLRIHGFEPAVATAKPGKVILVINNQTGAKGLVYGITSKQGLPLTLAGVTQIRLSPTALAPHGTLVLNLNAGVYTITEASQPKWTCTLTVQ